MTVLQTLDELEQHIYKLDYIESVSSLLAERLEDNDESNVAWLISNICRDLKVKLEEGSDKLRDLYRLEQMPIKKGKK